MSSQSTFPRVQSFFEQPQHYFHKDYHVTVRAEIVREMIPDASGMKILDIGCGDGRVSLQFLRQAASVTLVDVSESMLRLARANVQAEYTDRASFFRGDFMDYNPEISADLVVCLGVLAHVDQVEAAIRKLAALTRVGGYCVLQITDCERLMGKIQHWSLRSLVGLRGARGYRLQRTRFQDIETLAAGAGFSLARRRDHCLVVPGMGRLPNQWLLRYDRFVVRHRILERFASSAVMLFRRCATTEASPSPRIQSA